MTNETFESILFEVRNRIASKSANGYTDQELSAVMDRIEAVVKEERSNRLKASKEVMDIRIQRRDKIIQKYESLPRAVGVLMSSKIVGDENKEIDGLGFVVEDEEFRHKAIDIWPRHDQYMIIPAIDFKQVNVCECANDCEVRNV